MNKYQKYLMFTLLAALMAALFTFQNVAAQEAKPTPSDDQVNVVARQMYCPICENIPLDVCPTTSCAEWRELIREKLALGWDAAQIKQFFAAQYGDRVLAEPPARGLNWLIYVLPPLVLLGGAFIVYRVLTGMSKKPAASPPGATPYAQAGTDEGIVPLSSLASKDPYVQRMEEELRKKQRE